MTKPLSPLDKLLKKVYLQKPITLSQACGLLAGKYLSEVYLDFKDWAEERKLGKQKMQNDIWYGIFVGAYLPLSERRLQDKRDAAWAAYNKKMEEKNMQEIRGRCINF